VVFAAIGHHPNSATGFADEDAQRLRELAAHPRCRAIGETGLDYYREYASPVVQRDWFRAHIAMAKHAGSFNFILDCVSAQHDINAYLNLLRRDGTVCLVGAPDKPLPVASFNLLFGRRSLSGSAIGGIRETQEMLDFCGEHGITADVEKIRIQQINEAYDRLLKQDVKYRFVIDNSTLQ